MENYEAPSITTIGSLHDMTLQLTGKAFGASDGVALNIPGVESVPIGDDPNNNGYPIS